MKRTILPVVVAGVGLLIAGCGSSPHTPTVASTVKPSSNEKAPSASPAPSPMVTDGNILIAPTGYAPGPFRITPVYCGKFSAAQQNQYGTNAAGGLIYRFANDSNTLTGSPNVSVNFLTGSNVAGANVSGAQTAINPGQNGNGEVDAVGGSGQSLAFTRCEIESYGIVTSAGGQPGTYAP